MTGLVGSWRQQEKDLDKAEKEFKRNESLKKSETDKRKLDKDSKLTFVRHFFPDVNITPGGKCNLRKLTGCTYGQSKNYEIISYAQSQKNLGGLILKIEMMHKVAR